MSDDDSAAYAEAFATVAARAAVADASDATLDAEIGALRDAGLLYTALPEALTGTAVWADRPNAVATILSALGRASLPAGRLFEGHINAAQLIGLYGTPALKRRAVDLVKDGSLLGVWGADGSDPVFTVPDGDGFRLAGQKSFCSGLGLVRLALLSATSDGTRLVAIDVDDPTRADALPWAMSGMRATRSGSYDFTGLAFTDDAVVGKIDDYYREPYFLGGMYRMGAVQVGGIDALIAAFVAVLHARGNAEDPVQQYRLGECGMLQLLARSAVEHVAGLIQQGTDPTRIAHYAVLMREGIEHCTTEILHRVERGAGTAAHRTGSDLDRCRRDLGLYIRQGALDTRLKAAGFYLSENVEEIKF